MKKKRTNLVVQIDRNLCTGCGACAKTCHMGAIQMMEGKAKVVDPNHCDGLGRCLPKCPVDAITLVERKTATPEDAPAPSKPLPCGCPGSMAKKIERKPQTEDTKPANQPSVSELGQWPIQIHLVNPSAPYLQNADLLIAADCTAYAYGNFHQDFIKGRILLVGCPKLDDMEAYIEKFVAILGNNDIKSITVARMSVPCCTGISDGIKKAMLQTGKILPFRDAVIATDGTLL